MARLWALQPCWLRCGTSCQSVCCILGLRHRYESIIATLCENLDTLDEPEAKASMIWIIGEYAERIDNADELLEQFLETFPEETSLASLRLCVMASTTPCFAPWSTDSSAFRPQCFSTLLGVC